jgi:DNA-binding transcriptional ArsR family regulator
MSVNSQIPDYELDDHLVMTDHAQLRAYANRLRVTLLDLLTERAATVSELAAAVGRPKSSVAHHVNVLVDAGLLRVVRTRRVRAIDERYYGRTARSISVGMPDEPWQTHPELNRLSWAASESIPAHEADDLRALLLHARIPREQVRAFWRRVDTLAGEFAAIPREGDEVYAFVAGLYPTDAPTLPDPESQSRVTSDSEAESAGDAPSPAADADGPAGHA